MARNELAKVYNPHDCEERWFKMWLERGYFSADAHDQRRPTFSVVIPPPNVTGSLHMGHALNNTLQDIVVRYQRMLGKNVLWIVGTDHAGIATQNVVEKKLTQEGRSRHELGREKFIAEVWQWKNASGNTILKQLKSLGASCDYSRERFTMDEGLSAAVRHVFVSLYNEGLIVRGERLINWCLRCHTALSDLEVEHRPIPGKLWHIRYPLAKDTQQCVTVATTRPETLLGDTAVAVHPEDGRYQDLIGQQVLVPLQNRAIPIIADAMVDREFGSGVVKITPAHDFNDFLAGHRHALAVRNILTTDGRLNENGYPFTGLDRFEARERVLAELKACGLLERVAEHPLSLGECYRCHTVVEPYLSKQWFVTTKPLAAAAIKAVQESKTRFIPAHWEKTYFQWLENIQDWCISRQIWWGHRIPVWYCPKITCPPIVTTTTPWQCPCCQGTGLTQDPDVLDTWFSSALWPFSTLGWTGSVASTELTQKFYPTSVLVTGFDIIFFWVSRMMMMGLKFMGDVPFRDVYIHALVRDATGQKMSKSKGNVIDPLHLMAQYGTDAFRFTLTALAAQGRDIKMDEERLKGYRNFCNKIWNAARFILMNISDPSQLQGPIDFTQASETDLWIWSELNLMVKRVHAALENYEFNVMAQVIYDFFWHEFCDWYLELAKPILQAGQEQSAEQVLTTQKVLYQTLEQTLQLCHPVMPFITEEIWHRLETGVASIVISDFPQPRSLDAPFQRAARVMNVIIAIVEAVRRVRGEQGLSGGTPVAVVIVVQDATLVTLIQGKTELLKKIGRLESLAIASEKPADQGYAIAPVQEGITVCVHLAGLIDTAKERERLTKEIKTWDKKHVCLAAKLANPHFRNKAPAAIIAKDASELSEVTAKLTSLHEALKRLEGLA